ncbi:MAG: hypothetical protein PHQ96_00805 [Candidatus Omnitrophica bacterium]|nr:hypothetical protein [Candidatus Omnitrophota bacterium]
MDKYIGVSLIFAYREKAMLMAHKADFILKKGSSRYFFKTADSIGKSRSWGIRGKTNEFNEYLGIYEFFNIVGPLTHGAKLGQHSFWSYKKFNDAEKLLRNESNFRIHKFKAQAKENKYIAEIIYYHGAPQYKSHRSLRCLGVVQSLKKDKVLIKAIELGKSLTFKKKIILKDYEKKFDPSELEFVGIADIRPILEKLKVGNCFQIAYKEYHKFSSILRIVPSRKKIEKNFSLWEKG